MSEVLCELRSAGASKKQLGAEYEKGKTDGYNEGYAAGISNGGKDDATNGLSYMGFVNPPSEGNWVMKTGTKTLSAKDPNIIPIVAATQSSSNSGADYYDQWGLLSTQGSVHQIKKCDANGVSASFYASKNANGSSHVNWGINATAQNVFLPVFQGFDLTKTQNAYTSGTFSAWLEKTSDAYQSNYQKGYTAGHSAGYAEANSKTHCVQVWSSGGGKTSPTLDTGNADEKTVYYGLYCLLVSGHDGQAKLEGSNDSTNWTQIFARGHSTNAYGQGTTKSSYRYFRVTASALNDYGNSGGWVAY